MIVPTELILLPSLKARVGPNGGLVLTQKYLDGAAAYARSWPGKVTSLLRSSNSCSWDMDAVEIEPGNYSRDGHAVEVFPKDRRELAARLASAALVFPFLAPNEWETLAICQSLQVPVVFGTEYSALTERQIIDSETRNPMLRWRRKRWAAQAEQIRLKMLHLAAGVQCSGTPTYDVYCQHNENALLFFDSRVPLADILSEEEVILKSEAVKASKPLRLIFGGRLIAMKGVLDLPEVADELRRLGVDFQLEIYGQGDLQPQLQKRIKVLDLQSSVRMGGVLDFKSGWLPCLRQHADLFLCCHPQGDPSSTYPEVMSCGVPIIGYDNEALAGIVRESGCGWVTPIGDAKALARQLVQLADRRDLLATAARQAVEFARKHAFERTFARRSAHLKERSRLPAELKQHRHGSQSRLDDLIGCIL
jgi:glycosyltransferase involved in cell wall biosynthesis